MKEEIYEYLKSIMKEDYKSTFVVEDLKNNNKISGYSYSIVNSALLRVKIQANAYRVEFYNFKDKEKDLKPLIHSEYPIIETLESKGTKLEKRVIYLKVKKDEEELFKELKRLEEVLKIKMLDVYLNRTPELTYGCCGLYLQCSDAKKCLRDVKDIEELEKLDSLDEVLYARGCAYRKNLEEGIVFYGKNANAGAAHLGSIKEH